MRFRLEQGHELPCSCEQEGSINVCSDGGKDTISSPLAQGKGQGAAWFIWVNMPFGLSWVGVFLYS